MEILSLFIILTIATVMVIGWFYGSLFVCVFLTLPVAGAFLIASAQTTSPTGKLPFDLGFGLPLAVLLIWLPRIYRWTKRGY